MFTQIQNYLNENREALELTESDIQNWRITNEHFAKRNNLHHVYISQEYNGVEVFGANAVFAIKGETVMMANYSKSERAVLKVKIGNIEPK